LQLCAGIASRGMVVSILNSAGFCVLHQARSC
jgi:hypothetical protein